MVFKCQFLYFYHQISVNNLLSTCVWLTYVASVVNTFWLEKHILFYFIPSCKVSPPYNLEYNNNLWNTTYNIWMISLGFFSFILLILFTQSKAFKGKQSSWISVKGWSNSLNLLKFVKLEKSKYSESTNTGLVRF